VTPGISALEYEARRTALMNMIPEGGIVILQGNKLRYSSGVIL